MIACALNRFVLLLFLCVYGSALYAQEVVEIPVDSGWAKNSVNAVVFRKNSLVSFRDTQFVAFYNSESFVVLGKRSLHSKTWQFKKTPFKGNTADAHNMISIMVDGAGYLHMAWDHHNNPLNYCRSVEPGSLEMTAKIIMTGKTEKNVSYPEFYKMPDGNLLFIYRDGSSGKGNLVINKYSIINKQWRQLHGNLIDGEGERNAYWQACTDNKGTVHLSWVWRETPDVASNHDMCYAKSTDGGLTWKNSNGVPYKLPITAASAEYAIRIPQKSELINQTSMIADAQGQPFIATYFRDSLQTVPQYHIIFKKSKQWQVMNLGFRKTPFSLGGAGTRKIPVSRPQVLAWQVGKKLTAAVIFRDEERGSKVSVASNPDLSTNNWSLRDLNDENLSSWEPTYDTELWKEKGLLHLFVQKVEQVDAEGNADVPPTIIKVIEWKPAAP